MNFFDYLPETGLIIPSQIMTEMIDHGLNQLPNEGCGIISGSSMIASRFFKAKNLDESPVSYSLDPEDLMSAMAQAEAVGDELLAIFHTHPTYPAFPSWTDVRLALWPRLLYLIMSFEGREIELNGFEIRDGWVRRRTLILPNREVARGSEVSEAAS